MSVDPQVGNQGISFWNDQLTTVLKTLDTEQLPDSEAEVLIAHYYRQFYPAFRQFLLDTCTAPSFRLLLNEPWRSERRLPPTERRADPEQRTPAGEEAESVSLDTARQTVELFGRHSAVPLKVINEINQNSAAYRFIERVEVSPSRKIDAATLRRFLRLPRSFSFQARYLYNARLLQDLEEGWCSVFRAEIKEETVSDLIDWTGKLEASLGDTRPVEFTPVPDDGRTAHGPLHMASLTRSDVDSAEKRSLSREYMLPWLINDTILNAAKLGQPIVGQFELETPTLAISFQRVDWVQAGKVHNFESMLRLMEDKFAVPPHETSERMEELYLGT